MRSVFRPDPDCRFALTSIRRVLLVLTGALVSPVFAMQVCTTQVVGNDDFRGVDGSGDRNVIAVGRRGAIARYDGASWSALTSPTNRDLQDVHVLNAGEAFAVGRNGEILQQNGALWTQHAGVTGQELRGVWAASASEVWVVGRRGTIFSYDGSVWSDESTAAGTSNRDVEDAWGDASAFYAVDERGNIFRYDRSSGIWDPPDTLCTFGGGFEDLWGDGAGNLYLVRRRNIYRHDGSSCTLIATASENLFGISGATAGPHIYAVGRRGAVMHFDGSSWQETQEGTQELRDDWVSLAGDAYFAGRRGELTVCQTVQPQVVADWHFDDCSLDLPGSTVLDTGPNGLDGLTVGAVSLETTGQLCPAAGLDGSSGYVAVPDSPALDLTQGISFAVWVRHNASTLTNWEAIFAKGDSAYRLHLNGGCEIPDSLPGNASKGITFGLNGGCSGADLNSNVVPVAGVWYHIAGTYDRSQMRIYINGALVNSAAYSTAINRNNFDLFIGENSQQRGRYWDGDIDELTLWDSSISATDVQTHMNRTRPCSNCSGAEFVIAHDNFGIHCLNETVRVDVVDSLAGTPRIDYNSQVTLDTQSGSGSWLLVSGGGTFSDATGNDGLATYDWPLGESFAVFALDYPAGVASIDVDVFDSIDPAIRDQDGEGNLVFSASGFTLTGSALSNPPPAVIAPFGGPRIAGTVMPLYLTAFGQIPTDPQCGVIENYSGARNLKFWSSYLNPASGTVAVGIDGIAAATAEAAAAPQPVAFVNGQAAIGAKYKDVGLLQIFVKDDSLAHPDLPAGIRGATASFVVKPDHFELSGIEDGVGNPNPAAGGPAGPVFIAAGQAFTVTVTAVDAEGDATPNYGLESTPETVSLTSTLVAPLVGNNPPLSAATGFGTFFAGAATATDFSWPEVGIITLTPAVGDGSYLTGGAVGGQVSGNVGRFVPAWFDVTLNTPVFSTACGSGGFTYIGESFDYAIAAQISLAARSVTASVTQNYTGAFFNIDNSTLTNRTYSATLGTLDTGGLPAPASDPIVADLGGGLATLTFSAGSGLTFARTTPAAPFDADIRLSIDVADSDAVATTSNPVVFGSPGGITFDAGRNMRYGRARLANGIGSELVDLALPLTTQFFVDSATGFVVNSADDCTASLPLSFSAWAGGLDAGETCVLDSGSPGASNAGCVAPSPPADQYRAPPLAGDFNLSLAAPGAGNGGSVTVTGDAPAWLEFDWDVSLPGFEDPLGTATFGIYSGNARRIYLREVY